MGSQATALDQGHDRAARLRAAAAARVSITEPHLLAARISAKEGGGGRLALEPLEAPSLAAVLRRRGPLGPRTAVTILGGLARAVDALEHNGLVARDLTPGNVLLDRKRGAVLVDFGVPPELMPLDRAEPDPEVTFRAPEERVGGSLTPRASVYSLGAILLATLTGKTPPAQIGATQKLRGRDVPPTLRSVIARAMAADPARRYATADELAVAAVEAVRLGERLLAQARVGERQMGPKPVRVLRGARPAAVPDDRVEREAAEAKRRAQEAAAREAAAREQRAAAARDQRAAEQREAAERERRAAAEREERAADERAERERLRASRAERKAAKRAGRRRRAAQDAERKAAQAARRKRARALARRRMRGESAGHITPAPAHSQKPKAAPERRGPRHRPAEPKHRREQAPLAAATKGSRVRRATAISALALVVAGAAAAALAPGGDVAKAARTPVVNGDLSVLLPAGWERTGPGSARLGSLADRTTAEAPDGSATLTVAAMREPRRTAARLRALAPGEARPATTRLGRLEVSAYRGLRTRPGSTGIAYVLNTTGASVLVVCEASGDPRARLLRECAGAASTVRLSGDSPLTVEAAAARPRAVQRTLATLGAARIADRKRLATAPTSEALADAGLDLQVRYYEAARNVQATGLPGIRAKRLVAALTRTGDAYGALADAVIDGDEAAYDSARVRVLAHEARLWK